MLASILSVAVDAVLITLVLALAASGLAVIFGLIGVINLGHGAMLTLGAYFMWWATAHGTPFVLAVLLAALGVCLVGLLLEHLLIRHFYDEPFETLLLTWGFFLVCTEVIKLAFGTDFRNVANPLSDTITVLGLELPAYRSLVALLSLVLLLALAAVIFRTGIGIKVRALVQNREVASLLGLDVGLVYKQVFAAGTFLAGLAGALISPMLSIDPYIGNVFLIRSFFAVTVGGLGQILAGTLVGSFVIGGAETLFALVSSQVFAQTVVFALAIVLLRFRPAGLVGGRR
ncbi:branched-chain amino acid ABC transporter permease [Benzoatithermus flavus]|uniref:Branched-chain amino acid ABC transporter permease n=1 Tax=Benzoatithermus flavus TaxID=3108223 RepID=A0ABU8XSY0_9PROT